MVTDVHRLSQFHSQPMIFSFAFDIEMGKYDSKTFRKEKYLVYNEIKTKTFQNGCFNTFKFTPSHPSSGNKMDIIFLLTGQRYCRKIFFSRCKKIDSYIYGKCLKYVFKSHHLCYDIQHINLVQIRDRPFQLIYTYGSLTHVYNGNYIFIHIHTYIFC